MQSVLGMVHCAALLEAAFLENPRRSVLFRRAYEPARRALHRSQSACAISNRAASVAYPRARVRGRDGVGNLHRALGIGRAIEAAESDQPILRRVNDSQTRLSTDQRSVESRSRARKLSETSGPSRNSSHTLGDPHPELSFVESRILPQSPEMIRRVRQQPDVPGLHHPLGRHSSR